MIYPALWAVLMWPFTSSHCKLWISEHPTPLLTWFLLLSTPTYAHLRNIGGPSQTATLSGILWPTATLLCSLECGRLSASHCVYVASVKSFSSD